MRLSRRWLLVALAVYVVMASAAPLVYGAMADMEAPFSEGGTVIWTVLIPVISVLLIVFGAWLAYRGGPAGIVVTIGGGLMLLYFVGALPEIAQDAGLEWPF